jgi:DEAD/DEAH box helicase domain-containing protein
MGNVVYFDLETQSGFRPGIREWGGLRISVAVTYATQTGEYRIYREEEVQELVETLQRADWVVGYNVVDFDYRVLGGYTVLDFSHVPTLDLMRDIEQSAGVRLALEVVGEATLGIGKTGNGADAIKLWQAGKYAEVARYCCYDVKLTRLVHEYGAYHGKVAYRNRQTMKLDYAKVSWRLED